MRLSKAATLVGILADQTRVEFEFWHLVENDNQLYNFEVYCQGYHNGEKETPLFFLFQDLNHECSCYTRRMHTNTPWDNTEYLWTLVKTEPRFNWIMEQPTINWWVE